MRVINMPAKMILTGSVVVGQQLMLSMIEQSAEGRWGNGNLFVSDGVTTKQVGSSRQQRHEYSAGIAMHDGKMCVQIGGELLSWPDLKVVKSYTPEEIDGHGTDLRWYQAKYRKDNIAETPSTRTVYSDSHAVFTGRDSLKIAPIVWGPTIANEIVNRKGIERNHLIVWRRGEKPSVFKLAHNPIHLMMPDDGLTVYAVSRQAIFVIDLD